MWSSHQCWNICPDKGLRTAETIVGFTLFVLTSTEQRASHILLNSPEQLW